MGFRYIKGKCSFIKYLYIYNPGDDCKFSIQGDHGQKVL